MSDSRIAHILEEEKKQPDIREESEIDLPWIPAHVALADVRLNKKILTDKQIAEVNKRLQAKNGRFSKKSSAELKDLNLPFSIIKENGECYAIYKGLKQKKHLGQGAFGKVKLAQNLATGEWVAIKVHSKHIELARTEGEVLHALGRAKTKGHERILPSGQVKYYIVMDLYAGTDLDAFQLSVQKKIVKPQPQEWCDIALQMIQATQAIHAKHYVHRDIKPGNFIYDPNTNRIKLADVGLAIKMKHGQYHARALAGTPDYMAPELHLSTTTYTYNEKTDVFALGRSILETLGCRPYNTIQNLTHFSNNQYVTAFLNRMVAKDPSQRPSLAEAKQFFKAIRQKETPFMQKRIGIIDAGEYFRQTPEEKRKLIAGLKCMSEVVLIDKKVDHSKTFIPLYLSVVTELVNAGLNVKRTVFTYTDKHDLLSTLPERISADKEPTTGCLFHYFTKEYHGECVNTPIQPIEARSAEPKDYFAQIDSYRNDMFMIPREMRSPLIAVIQHLEEKMVEAAQPDQQDYFSGKSAAAISIKDYLLDLIRHTNMLHVQPGHLTAAMIYLDRYLEATQIPLTKFNIHRLMLTSFMLAVKTLDDAYPNNKHIAYVGGIPLEELNKLEIEFSTKIDFRVSIFKEYDFFQNQTKISDTTGYKQYKSDEANEMQAIREREEKHKQEVELKAQKEQARLLQEEKEKEVKRKQEAELKAQQEQAKILRQQKEKEEQEHAKLTKPYAELCAIILEKADTKAEKLKPGLFSKFSSRDRELENQRIQIWNTLREQIIQLINKKPFNKTAVEEAVVNAIIINIQVTQEAYRRSNKNSNAPDFGKIYKAIATKLYAIDPDSLKNILASVRTHYTDISPNSFVHNVVSPQGKSVPTSEILPPIDASNTRRKMLDN